MTPPLESDTDDGSSIGSSSTAYTKDVVDMKVHVYPHIRAIA